MFVRILALIVGALGIHASILRFQDIEAPLFAIPGALIGIAISLAFILLGLVGSTERFAALLPMFSFLVEDPARDSGAEDTEDRTDQ